LDSSPIFDLPHVFIVFAPGASGNFLSGIVTGLINKNYSDIAISESGSSHTTTSKKFVPNSDLSMGTFIDKTLIVDEKIKYYKELFSKLEVAHPIVSWTHDFKNIALYRNIFPNSKIIVVTQNTDEEKLAITFMHVIKNLMDDNVVTPIPADQFKYIQQSYRQRCINTLRESMSDQLIDIILSNPSFNNVLRFVYIKEMIKFYGLRHLVEDVPKQYLPDLDVSSPLLLSNKPYEVEKYLTDDCVQLPYSYLISNNVSMLLGVISTMLSRELSNDEKMFVTDNFNKYRAKQNLDILTSPVAYYKSLNDAFIKINQTGTT
jgi:hypothetical protein